MQPLNIIKISESIYSMAMIMIFAMLTSLLASCATPQHTILGTTYGFDNTDNLIVVLLDAKIDELRIRHVRMPSKVCVSGYRDHLEISGQIGPDSTAAVERLLPELAECKGLNGNSYSNTAYLSSGGGYLSDGYKLGELFTKWQIKTLITGGQTCASSCAIAFLGGKFRSMEYDARLLFHAPYIGSGIAIDCSDRGQVNALGNYYKSMLGAKNGEFLLGRTLSYCSQSSGWSLNADGAKLFGIIN